MNTALGRTVELRRAQHDDDIALRVGVLPRDIPDAGGRRSQHEQPQEDPSEDRATGPSARLKNTPTSVVDDRAPAVCPRQRPPRPGVSRREGAAFAADEHRKPSGQDTGEHGAQRGQRRPGRSVRGRRCPALGATGLRTAVRRSRAMPAPGRTAASARRRGHRHPRCWSAGRRRLGRRQAPRPVRSTATDSPGVVSGRLRRHHHPGRPTRRRRYRCAAATRPPSGEMSPASDKAAGPGRRCRGRLRCRCSRPGRPRLSSSRFTAVGSSRRGAA